jgi:hypothetical protein
MRPRYRMLEECRRLCGNRSDVESLQDAVRSLVGRMERDERLKPPVLTSGTATV